MTTQAERIKAFKLAQHTRLHKKEDEESWISGEELCTEGSSDEEMHSMCKTNHGKAKRQVRFERRGISPLAQTKPLEGRDCTSCSSSQENFLVPELRSSAESLDAMWSDDAERRNSVVRRGSSTEVAAIADYLSRMEPAEAADASCGSQETDSPSEGSEGERMIQWRPKRGSIKLPEFPEDAPNAPSLNLFEIEAFHAEMRLSMVELKASTQSQCAIQKHSQTVAKAANLKPLKEIATESHFAEVFKLPEAQKLSETIAVLAEQLVHSEQRLEKLRNANENAREEMAEVLSNCEISPTHTKQWKLFLQLHANEEEKNPQQRDGGAAFKAAAPPKKLKRNTVNDENKHDIVLRSIELAKEQSMASLTDEEKLRLSELLADLDSDKYSPDANHTREISVEDAVTENGNNCNVFKLLHNEVAKLEELNAKLQDLSNCNNQGEGNEVAQQPENEEKDILQNANKNGRYWKMHQLQQRLNSIDTSLRGIQQKETDALKKYEELKEKTKKQEDKNETPIIFQNFPALAPPSSVAKNMEVMQLNEVEINQALANDSNQ